MEILNKPQVAVFWVVTNCSDEAGYRRFGAASSSKVLLSCHITTRRHNL